MTPRRTPSWTAIVLVGVAAILLALHAAANDDELVVPAPHSPIREAPAPPTPRSS